MKTIRKILSRVAFFLALFIMLAFLRDTLLIKETTGIVPMKAYYGQPKGTVDVLILGSSHAGMNISTQTLWDEYGISSYVLWGAVQPLWNTYHNLLEALKTQTPKLVVVEMYIASTDEEYADKTRQVTNTIGMNLSLNKWDAIRVSAPPERWLDMLMELPLTHGHYKDLEEKDFHYYPWSDVTAEKGSVSLGYEIFDGMEEFTDELVDASTIREVKPLGEKSGSYLFKIIDLCKEKQLPLLLV